MVRPVALVLVLALVLGACGDDVEPARDRDRTSQSSAVAVVA
jgi:hypothetical protein